MKLTVLAIAATLMVSADAEDSTPTDCEIKLADLATNNANCKKVVELLGDPDQKKTFDYSCNAGADNSAILQKYKEAVEAAPECEAELTSGDTSNVCKTLDEQAMIGGLLDYYTTGLLPAAVCAGSNCEQSCMNDIGGSPTAFPTTSPTTSPTSSPTSSPTTEPVSEACKKAYNAVTASDACKSTIPKLVDAMNGNYPVTYECAVGAENEETFKLYKEFLTALLTCKSAFESDDGISSECISDVDKGFLPDFLQLETGLSPTKLCDGSDCEASCAESKLADIYAEAMATSAPTKPPTKPPTEDDEGETSGTTTSAISVTTAGAVALAALYLQV